MKTDLIVKVISTPKDKKIFELAEDWHFMGFTIPKGTQTDFASVPKFFCIFFPPIGSYCKAAVLHDWLCDERILSYQQTHSLFNEAMKETGVKNRIRIPMATAVKLFGPRW